MSLDLCIKCSRKWERKHLNWWFDSIQYVVLLRASDVWNLVLDLGLWESCLDFDLLHRYIWALSNSEVRGTILLYNGKFECNVWLPQNWITDVDWKFINNINSWLTCVLYVKYVPYFYNKATEKKFLRKSWEKMHLQCYTLFIPTKICI